MTCERCHGFMVVQQDFDFDQTYGRCVNCGNRKEMHAAGNGDRHSVASDQATGAAIRLAGREILARDTDPKPRRGWTDKQREAHRQTMKQIWEKRKQHGEEPVAEQTLVQAAEMDEPGYQHVLNLIEQKRDALDAALARLRLLRSLKVNHVHHAMAQA